MLKTYEKIAKEMDSIIHCTKVLLMQSTLDGSDLKGTFCLLELNRDKGFQLTEIRIIWDRGPKNWSYKGENSSVFEKKFLITNFFNMSFTKRCLWTTWLPGLLCGLIKMWLWMIWLYKITIKSIKRLL